jgi:hypothetical protein
MNHVEPVPFRIFRPISRSLFPCRYYLVDFEEARRFSPDSSPSDRRVSGLPLRRIPDEHAAPEIYIPAPYDPFAVDVYQLGYLIAWELAVRFQSPAEYPTDPLAAHGSRQRIDTVVPRIADIFASMTAIEPTARCSALRFMSAFVDFARAYLTKSLRRRRRRPGRQRGSILEDYYQSLPENDGKSIEEERADVLKLLSVNARRMRRADRLQRQASTGQEALVMCFQLWCPEIGKL